MASALSLYLDQNYLSGFVKHKPAFRELEPVLRQAVSTGIVEVFESEVHVRESLPRRDLRLLDLLRNLQADAASRIGLIVRSGKHGGGWCG